MSSGGGPEDFRQRVSHRRGPIDGSSLEVGMVVSTSDGGEWFTAQVKSVSRDGVTLGSRMGWP